jgi:hypothetical protein
LTGQPGEGFGQEGWIAIGLRISFETNPIDVKPDHPKIQANERRPEQSFDHPEAQIGPPGGSFRSNQNEVAKFGFAERESGYLCVGEASCSPFGNLRIPSLFGVVANKSSICFARKATVCRQNGGAAHQTSPQDRPETRFCSILPQLSTLTPFWFQQWNILRFSEAKLVQFVEGNKGDFGSTALLNRLSQNISRELDSISVLSPSRTLANQLI